MSIWDRVVDASWQAYGAMTSPTSQTTSQATRRQVPLSETGITKLDGSGNGTARVGPISAREVWHPENVHVSVSSNTNEALCSIYVGDSATQPNFRDNTLSGSTGDSTDRVNADIVRTGQYVWAVWTGGDANAQAIIAVTGMREV